MSPETIYYAAIDLGSNSCRLLVVGKNEQGLQTVDAYSRITRLSEGIVSTGCISEMSQERTLVTLKHMIKRLESKRYTICCVATEACRRARNTNAFLKRIYDETGLTFTVISPEREAQLAVMGLLPLFDEKYPYALTFDVGGGSTEAVLIKKATSFEGPQIMDWISIPLGVVSVLETHNPEISANYLRITEHVRQQFMTFGQPHGLRDLIEKDQIQVIGASGTATTAASIHLGLRYYSRDRIDGYVMTFEDVENVIKKLQMMSIDERARHPCIGPERADLVLGGMAIFEGLYHALPIHSITVADRGVRDGLIAEMTCETPLLPWGL